MPLHAVFCVCGRGLALYGLYDFDRWIGFVRGAGIDIEFGGGLAVLGGKLYLLCAHSDINALFMSYIVLLAVEGDYARAAYVDYAHFAAL